MSIQSEGILPDVSNGSGPTYTEYSEEDWLARRPKTIGASEVATILGLNRWKSPFTLFQEKTGAVAPPNLDGVLSVKLGHRIEPIIDELYREETGRHTRDPGEFCVVTNARYPFVSCTPDREIARMDVFKDDDGVLELKWQGEYGAAEWKEGEAPLAFIVQLYMQMALMDLKWGSIAGLIGNREFVYRDFERDDELIRKVMARVGEFANRVMNGDPPPVDGSKSTSDTLKFLHPKDNNQTVQLPAEAATWAEALAETKTAIKELKISEEEIKNEFKEAIGDATFGEYPGGRFSLRHQIRRGYARVGLGYMPKLDAAGIDYKVTETTEHRRLLPVKAR